MRTIQQEAWADCIQEILPIWKSTHAEETVDSTQDARLEVNPNLDIMHQLADVQMIVVFTVRDGPLLVGYAVLLVSPDFSCTHLLMCNVMLHYIRPKYRGQGLGTRLFDAVEQYAQQIGADGIMAGNKAHLPYGGMFEHLGYHVYGTTYIKWVEHETQA